MSSCTTVKIVHNTIVAAGTAGVTCEHALTGPKQELTVERNYFAAVKVILSGLPTRPPGLKTAGNARDAATAEGPVSTDAVAVAPDPLKPPNPNDDATFLRSPALTAQGAQKE